MALIISPPFKFWSAVHHPRYLILVPKG